MIELVAELAIGVVLFLIVYRAITGRLPWDKR
jgi:hypothetical protein